MGVARQFLTGTGYAYEALTVADSATAFTAATYSPTGTNTSAIAAFVTVEGGQIRYTFDGTTPTTLIGHLANVGDEINVQGGNNVGKFRAIRTGSNSSTLRVTYVDYD